VTEASNRERHRLARAFGWVTFPVPPGTKKSYKGAAQYGGRKWGATADPNEIEQDHQRWPDANLGIPTGEQNKFWVVEADTAEGHQVDGIANLRELERRYGALPPTRTVKSPSGSLHYYFKWDPRREVRNSASRIAPGIDVRGEGGMVVVPPSRKAGVGEYVVVDDREPAVPPNWLVMMALEASMPRPTRQATRSPRVVNWDRVRLALMTIPNVDVGWEDWNYVLMALWGGTRGDDRALALAHEWSRKSSKYNEQNTEAKWAEITGCPATELTLGTIFFMASEADPNWDGRGEQRDLVTELNEKFALVLAGNKTAVMMFENDTKFRLLQVGAFKQWHANRHVPASDGKVVQASAVWLSSQQRRQYEGIEFAPTGGRPGYYNLWRGFAVEPRQGDCSKFLAHLRDNVTGGDAALCDWVVGWFAQTFQKPGKKLDTSLVLRGKQGVGKTKVGQVFGSLMGDHYVLVSDPRYVTGQFNSHMASLLLLHADEAFWAGDKRGEGKLKDLVSGKEHFIEFKGVDPILVRNLIRLFVTGNPNWLVPTGFEERRFGVLDVLDTHMQDHAYFADIDEEMNNGGREALLHHLLHFNLRRVNLRSVPKTAALLEQKIETATPEQAWWLDTLKRGRLPGMVDEPNTCPREALFDDYVEHARRRGVYRKASETLIGIFLNKYVAGGAELDGGRRTYWMPDGSAKRGRCYKLPPLSECRRGFAEKLQQELEWEDADAEWINALDERVAADDDDYPSPPPM
jgi:hypothetical protein